jgi:hypothetical protein
MYLRDNPSAQFAPSVEYADDTGSLPGENGLPMLTTGLPSSTAVGRLRGLSNEASSKCEQAGGSCLDTNVYSCDGKLLTGYCPGASNIRCCVGTAKMKNGGTIKTGPPTAPPSYPGANNTVPQGVNAANFGNGALWVLAGIAVTKLLKLW